jgi:hypothetical protein
MHCAGCVHGLLAADVLDGLPNRHCIETLHRQRRHRFDALLRRDLERRETLPVPTKSTFFRLSAVLTP